MAETKDNKQPKKAKPEKASKAKGKADKDQRSEVEAAFKSDPGMAKYNALFVEREDKDVLEKSTLVALLVVFALLFVVFPQLASQADEGEKEDFAQVSVDIEDLNLPEEEEEEEPEQEITKVEQEVEIEYSDAPSLALDTDLKKIVSDEEINEEIDVRAEDVGFGDFGDVGFEAPGPVEVAGNIERPQANFPAIERFYPQRAKIMKRSGLVTIRLQVNKDGSFKILEILKENPPNLGFGEAAKDFLAETTFKPAMQNGKPLDVYYNLTLKFELN